MSRLKVIGIGVALAALAAVVLFSPAVSRNNYEQALRRCLDVADVSSGGIIRWRPLPRPGFMCSYHNSSGKHEEYLGYMPR